MQVATAPWKLPGKRGQTRIRQRKGQASSGGRLSLPCKGLAWREMEDEAASIESVLESVELIRAKNSAVDESLSIALSLLKPSLSPRDEKHKTNALVQQGGPVSMPSSSVFLSSAAAQSRRDDPVSLPKRIYVFVSVFFCESVCRIDPIPLVEKKKARISHLRIQKGCLRVGDRPALPSREIKMWCSLKAVNMCYIYDHLQHAPCALLC